MVMLLPLKKILSDNANHNYFEKLDYLLILTSPALPPSSSNHNMTVLDQGGLKIKMSKNDGCDKSEYR